jgi:hypothetical protein
MDLAAKYLRCRCPGGDQSEAHELAVKDGRCLNRCAKCGRTPIVEHADLPLFRSERGAHRFGSVVRCDHWTCPSCGTHYARQVAAELGAGIKAWLRNNEGYRAEEAPYDVWLFTTTIPHYRDDAMETTIALLYEVWARFVDSRAWREWSRRVGVRARVRAFDATFRGKNGTHPHFHVALFVDNQPGFRHAAALAHELDTKSTAFEVPPELDEAWLRACKRAGVDVRKEHAILERGLQLQGGDEAASYFVKWGLANETGATTMKRGGPLELLDAAGAGDVAAGELYRAFCLAVNGRQVVTGVRDMMRMVGISDDDVEQFRAARQAHLDAESPPKLVRPLELVVRRCLWRAALDVGLGVVVAEVDRADAAGEDVQAALDSFLFRVDRGANTTACPPPRMGQVTVESGIPPD